MIRRMHLLGALAGASLLPLASAASAQAQAQRPNQTFVDLQAGLGYSTNPEMRLGGVGSGFGRISAYGFHGWGSERSNSSVSGYVENTSYLRRYGSRQLFSVNATNTTDVSEKVRLFGNLGFSADYGAQLSSRFFGAPADTVPLDPVIPPTSVIVINPDLTALSQRQYQLTGSAGASISLSPRDSLITTVGGQRVFFKGDAIGNLDYTLLDTSVAFRRQINERLAAGVRLLASHTDYSFGRSVRTYGPQLTADLRLSESLQLGGAIGFVRTERDLGALGSSSSTDLAFDASVCRNLEYERFCGRVSRRTQSSAIGTAPASTSLTADYSRRLTATDQIQAAVAFVSSDAARDVGLGRQSFYSLSGSYDRKISPRLSAGVNLVARKLTAAGPDPRADLGGSLFIRNRLGSVR